MSRPEHRPEGSTTDPAWPFTGHSSSLRLVLAEPPAGKELVDLVDPFVPLHDRGAFSRTLLAELVGPNGERIMPLVLKLQSDEYPIVAETESAQWNNVSVESAWKREVELLERSGGEAGLPAPIEILSRPRGDAAHLPPTVFCKRRRAFFAAPCPRCGAPLADFRDSRALEDRALPRYQQSLVRFLGCTACVARGENTLYVLVREASMGGRDVGDQADLFRAWAGLARTAPASPTEARLPCQGCTHVPTCYPDDANTRGDAPRFLTPVSFYESRCIALEPLHLRYDEFTALLGAARFPDIVAAVGEPGRKRLLADVAPHFSDGPQYLFAQDAAGKLALEVLRLKLSLFAQLCRSVATLHRQSQAPHLGITPARAMVGIPAQRSGLPNLWNFRLTLLGLGNATPRFLRTGNADELPTRPYVGPRLIDPVFSAPPLRELPAADQPGVLTLRRLTAAPEGRTVLHAELTSHTADFAELGDKDVVEVTVVQGRPPLSLSFVAAPEGRAGRALALRSTASALDAETRASAEQLIGQPLARARYTVYPCLDAPCDVHGLGMMLFTSLLANTTTTPAQVARVVGDVATQTTAHARQQPEAGTERIGKYAASLLGAEEFGKPQVFADPARHTGAATTIPDGLWLASLLVALRAVTTVPAFSICRSYTDFDPAHREVKAEFLASLVDSLIREVDAALFGLPGRRREIREAIARVVADRDTRQ